MSSLTWLGLEKARTHITTYALHLILLDTGATMSLIKVSCILFSMSDTS